MDATGEVTRKGSGKYPYVVRFEAQDDALAYLQRINVPASVALYNAIITNGSARSENYARVSL